MKKLEKMFLVLMFFLIVEGIFCFTACTKTEEEVFNESMEVTKVYLDNPTEKNYKKLMKQKEKLEKFMAKKQKNEAIDESNLEKEREINKSSSVKEEPKSVEKLPQTYEEWLAKAKEYESQKKWCYALGAYYDAMGTVDLDPEYKTEAVNGYNALKETILSGNPGIGTFNEFTLHDEWKKLLIDAEKYGSSFNPYLIEVGNLVKGDLDYTTKTASYSAKISYGFGNRYNGTIRIIEEGYVKAYKYDWHDLPKEWPKYSASYDNDGIYNVNGAYIYRVDEYYEYNKETIQYCYNAFARETPNYTLVDCKFNIVDENGKELVKPKRCLLGAEDIIEFKGITPEIMDLIDNGKAFLNPVACYLEYGKYDSYIRKGDRDFIKYIQEIQLPLESAEIICWNNKFYKIKDVSFANSLANIDTEMLVVSENIKVCKTEVTQSLYESVMDENPSYFKGLQNPVENVSWYDAIYFCNKLSVVKGLEPVYSVNGNSDFSKWNYTPHQEEKIEGEIKQNTFVNGYRLPTRKEWQYAAKGGQDYKYAGSEECFDVAWYQENRTHPVALKKANGYGLYDMSGNVREWIWDGDDLKHPYGGSYHDSNIECRIDSIVYEAAYRQFNYVGFRIVRTITE